MISITDIRKWTSFITESIKKYYSIRTETGIRLHGKCIKNELPETVRNVIEKQYKEYNLDDAEYIEKANDTKYYRIDLELGETDLTVNIDSDGNVIP